MIGEMGRKIHNVLPDEWRMVPEGVQYRSQVLETVFQDAYIKHLWADCRLLPTPSHWFERDWAAFERGDIFLK